MDFDYNKEELWKGNIDIPRIGQCALEGINEDGLYFYFICTTKLGWTTICTFGPTIPDSENNIVDTFTWTKYGIEYKEDRISKAIFSWLNSKNKIVEAKLIEIEDAISFIPDIKHYINYDGGDDCD